MDWMDGDSHGTELNLDSTGGEKASRFPEVMLLDSLNLVGSIAGLGHDVVLSVVFGWFVVQVDFILSSVISSVQV